MGKLYDLFRKLTKLKPGVTVATTSLSLVGGVLGIKQYRENHPSLDLTGKWLVETTVQHSEYRPYEGLHLAFHVFLHQQGNKVSGTGEKWTENGRRVVPNSRSQVVFEGILHGDELVLSYIETGTKRSTMGQYELHIEDGSSCEGSISGTAANASGPTVWRRQASF